MHTTLARIASVSLACLATLPASAGDEDALPGINVRIVEITSANFSLSSVFDSTETIRSLGADLGSSPSARMNLGLEVAGGGGEMELTLYSGSVLLREIGVGNTYYTSSATISLADGRYFIAGASSDANFEIEWSEWSFGDGDMTIASLDGTNASATFHPSEDTGRLWLGTSPAADSEIEATFHAFGEDVERPLMWVNDVSGGTTLAMPAEASDVVDTLFAEGDHELTMGPLSTLSIRLDRDEESDGGSGEVPCPVDVNGDGEINGADLGLVIAAWGTYCP